MSYMLVGSLGVAIEDHIVTWIQLALLSVRLRRFTSQIIELHKEEKKSCDLIVCILIENDISIIFGK